MLRATAGRGTSEAPVHPPSRLLSSLLLSCQTPSLPFQLANLLWIEELQLEQDIRRYDIEGREMTQSGAKFLALQVRRRGWGMMRIAGSGDVVIAGAVSGALKASCLIMP